MLKSLDGVVEGGPQAGWLQALSADFSHRLVNLFAYAFRDFDPYLALSLVENGRQQRLTGIPSCMHCHCQVSCLIPECPQRERKPLHPLLRELSVSPM